MLPRVPGETPRDLSRPLEELRARVYPELAGQRLDQALRVLLPWRSRSSLVRLIKDGSVAVERASNARSSAQSPARASMRVQAEDIVCVQIPKRLRPDDPRDWPADAELDVLFEDRWLVAIDKPAGLAVHPSGRRVSGTLINALHARYRNVEDPARDVVPRLCHRLDRETSGLVLVAKDGQAHAGVRRQFEALTVRKSYLAIVEGRPEADEGLVDASLGPDSRSSIRLKIAVRADGLDARTLWRVRSRHGALTLLECFPRTGRQHQIRVHLAYIGLPIVGDKLYGPDEDYFLAAIAGELTTEARARLRLPRQALHSHTLQLEHPKTGTALHLESPLPEDLAELLGRR